MHTYTHIHRQAGGRKRGLLSKPTGANAFCLQTGPHCKSTWRSKKMTLRHAGCLSTSAYQPKFCSTCKRTKCCGPGRTRNIHVVFKCANGRMFAEQMMWIKSCECRTQSTCPARQSY